MTAGRSCLSDNHYDTVNRTDTYVVLSDNCNTGKGLIYDPT